MRSKLLQQKSFKYLLIFLLSVLLFLVGSVFYIPYYGNQLSQESESYFYQRSADAITVFTGDKGRITKAFELAKKMTGANLLITGVHNNNSLKSIANKQIGELSSEKFVENYSHLIEIDYEAKNTIENVIASLIYSRQNPATKEIIIVSSDYHLPRIKLILSFLQEETDKAKFHFYAVKTTSNDFQNIKRYFKEIFRLLKSVILLTLWD